MSLLQSRLRSGQFVVTAEITPPVSTDPAEFLARARPLKGLATAVNVTDGAGAKVHISSLAATHFLVQIGVEPIFQMTCRDRNRLALQGDLIGAAAFGVHNVLILAGDDPKVGDQPDAKAVHDVDSRTLIAMAHGMRSEKKLPSGTPIAGEFDMFIGAADVPVDPKPGWEPKGLMAKAAAGADFVQTQFCMDTGVVRRYAARLRELGFKLPILVGVAPIPSARSARWMREKLFGTLIPDSIVERLEKARDPKAEGNRICVEILRQLAEIPGVAGAHVMAPMNFAAIPLVIEESGVLKKKQAA
jgi:methylenetetrahydrofolate reductase (NADPH)